ncbi:MULTISPECIES: hypothetical protein [unclassified Streptomyces]|nr:hypothetical protein [Streptomyces sp. CB01883]
MEGAITGGMMATEGHDEPDAEPAADTPKARFEQGSWAADNVPLIVLALIVVVLGIAGGMSNDNVTCPGGASSCGVP